MHAEPTPLPNFSSTYYWPSVLPFFSAADLADPKNIDVLVSAKLINTLLNEAGYPDIPIKYVYISYDFPGRRRVKTVLSGKASGSIFLGVTVVDMYTFAVRAATAISKAVGIPLETATMFLYMNTSPLVYALAAFVRKAEPHTPLTAEVFEGEIEEPDAERMAEGFIASAEYTASLVTFSPSYVDVDYVRKEAAKALLDSLWALKVSASKIPEELLTASERIADAVESRYT